MKRTYVEDYADPRSIADEEPETTDDRTAEREETHEPAPQLCDGEILQRYEG